MKASIQRNRAQALAGTLKEALGLDVCEPLFTEEEAAARGQDLPAHVVKFYLQRDGMSTAVPIARKALVGEDEAYLARLVARVWLSHLKTVMGQASYVMALSEVARG